MLFNTLWVKERLEDNILSVKRFAAHGTTCAMMAGYLFPLSRAASKIEFLTATATATNSQHFSPCSILENKKYLNHYYDSIY